MSKEGNIVGATVLYSKVTERGLKMKMPGENSVAGRVQPDGYISFAGIIVGTVGRVCVWPSHVVIYTTPWDAEQLMSCQLEARCGAGGAWSDMPRTARWWNLRFCIWNPEHCGADNVSRNVTWLQADQTFWISAKSETITSDCRNLSKLNKLTFQGKNWRKLLVATFDTLHLQQVVRKRDFFVIELG